MKWEKQTKCLGDKILQEYIDRELEAPEMELIEKHISYCEICRIRFEEKQKLIDQLKSEISTLSDIEINIPEFGHSGKVKKISARKRNIIRWGAAALIILLLSLFLGKYFYTPDSQIDTYIVYEITDEVDANKPWDEQSSTFYILNDKGEVIDRIIFK